MLGKRLAHLAMPKAYPLEVRPVEGRKAVREDGMTFPLHQWRNASYHCLHTLILQLMAKSYTQV